MITPTRLLSLLLLNFAAPMALAATLYVDNDLARPALYRTLSAAVTAASDGDTIIVQASSLPYAGAYIGKRLTIRGNGFGGDATPNLLGNPTVATFNTKVTIGGTATNADRISANGTVVEGLLASEIELNSSNCIIRRCSTSFYFNVRGPANRLEGCLLSTTSLGSPPIALSIDDTIIINNQRVPVTGIEVRNCIVNSSVYCRYVDGNTDFHHCVFRRSSGSSPGGMGIYMKNTRFYNSIFGDCTASNDAFQTRDQNPQLMQNCLFLDGTAVMGNGTGTITDTYTNTFQRAGQWGEPFRIKPGAAALTASTTGGESGVFGGPTPFKVGGYPAIPRILRTELLSADPATGIRIKVEAESRD